MRMTWMVFIKNRAIIRSTKIAAIAWPIYSVIWYSYTGWSVHDRWCWGEIWYIAECRYHLFYRTENYSGYWKNLLFTLFFFYDCLTNVPFQIFTIVSLSSEYLKLHFHSTITQFIKTAIRWLVILTDTALIWLLCRERNKLNFALFATAN